MWYLDSLDFGARIIDQSLPRLSVWNGNMFKFFSDLDHKKKNIFGKRQLKKNLPCCYREVFFLVVHFYLLTSIFSVYFCT